MCYLLRHQQRAVQEEGETAPAPPGQQQFRPRWAFAVVGGLALGAAFVGAGSAPVPSARAAATPAPLAARTAAHPSGATLGGGGAGQGSGPVDDEVPTAARAGLGHCEHDL